MTGIERAMGVEEIGGSSPCRMVGKTLLGGDWGMIWARFKELIHERPRTCEKKNQA